MNLGIGLDITRAGQVVSFSPENLRVGTRDVRDLTVRPNRLYSDVAGTTLIAGPGAAVAAMRDSRGILVATQALLAAQPHYGLRPAVGIRNRANGSAMVADAAVWQVPAAANGITVTKTATGETSGEPWARYQVVGTASATYFGIIFNIVNSRTPAVSGAQFASSIKARLFAGTYPASLSGLRLDTLELNAANTQVQTTTNLLAVTGTDTTFTTARTLTDATTTQAQMVIAVRVETGQTVDFTIDVTAAQFETGAVRTAWQRNASAFDITETGVRSLDCLMPDSIDDHMLLAAAFTPPGNYMMAAAIDLQGGVISNIFGNTANTNARFFRNVNNELQVWANETGNRSSFAGATGRSVNVARVSGTGLAEAYINGTGPLSGTLTGAMTPMAAGGINAIFAGGSGRIAPRAFFGGVLVDPGNTPITSDEVLLTRAFLADRGGVTL